LPEYTLLPRPVQDTIVNLRRRSTRRSGVVVNSLDAKHPRVVPRQSLPPDSDPPPNGRVDLVSSSEPIIPESPRTDDQKDEIDVERMVESGNTLVEPSGKQVDGQGPAVSTDDQLEMAVDRPDSPTLLYPEGSPLSRLAALSPSDPQVDVNEEMTHSVSASLSEGDAVKASGIPPSTFYGTKSDEKPNVTPQMASVDNSVPTEIEIDEDETMGNADSEPEEAAEYVFLHPASKLSLMSLKTSKDFYLHLRFAGVEAPSSSEEAQ
jgi:hypothetical protein